ncbi:hypothetical protein FMM05_11150 [Flavobacterium zepuense]|uniref:Uncharacterized protein n=1 Tax=Flavobacterium zepuense TaxID=2593302 RepID=A0A552V1N1_9FLAO|nr:hypothetical protein [Flavobacterium zepuense]TRW24381.1 hypothetical protein FMM05_11150 [Flavobacterium zepuense]
MMEHIASTQENGSAINAIHYQMAAAEFEKEANEVKADEETSCSLLLKNLLMTNLKLLKLNEIGSLLMF